MGDKKKRRTAEWHQQQVDGEIKKRVKEFLDKSEENQEEESKDEK